MQLGSAVPDKKPSDDTYSDKEARERFERALKAGLSTPPKHLKDVPRKRPKRQRKESSDSS
jgi:hypothetical protein